MNKEPKITCATIGLALSTSKMATNIDNLEIKDHRGINQIIINHEICANDIEIIINHFLFLCDKLGLHGNDLKRCLEKNYANKHAII